MIAQTHDLQLENGLRILLGLRHVEPSQTEREMRSERGGKERDIEEGERDREGEGGERRRGRKRK